MASKAARSFRLPRPALARRGFATVADPPVRRYGGLKDQDRIFTNAFCKHDHGLKGAKVRILRSILQLDMIVNFTSLTNSLEETGIVQRISFSRVTHGSFKPSKTLDCVVVEAPDSLPV